MKFSCQAEDLTKALSVLAVVTRRRTTLPVLSNVKVSVSGISAVLEASDLEMAVQITVRGVTYETGECLLPGRQALRFMCGEKGTVILSASERKACLSGNGDSKASLEFTDLNLLEDFPPIEGWSEAAFRIDGLPTVLNRVWPMSASEESRPVLNGVLFQSEDGILDLVAADGFRLIKHRAVVDTPVPCKFIIPRSVCVFLSRVMQGKVSVGISESRVTFRSGDITILSQIIQGTFPAYQSLIPQDELVWTARVSAPLLQRRLQQFEGATIARIQPKDGALNIVISAECEGRYETTMPAEIKGEGRIAMNREYLLAISRFFAEMEMQVTSPSSPMKVVGDLEDVLVVVMPMFVQW